MLFRGTCINFVNGNRIGIYFLSKYLHLGRNNLNHIYAMVDQSSATFDVNNCSEEKDLHVIFDQWITYKFV